MLNVRPYTAGDRECIKVRNIDLGQDIIAENLILQSLSYTIFIGEEPVACGGVIPAGGGVVGCWTIISDNVRGQGLALTRKTKFLLADAMRCYDAHRAQMIVVPGKKEYMRWAKLLGFETEGLLRQATHDKQDRYLMAKVI